MMQEYLYTLVYTDNQLIPDRTEQIGSVDVPLYMIGDSAYPMHSWLMKPFSFSNTATHIQLQKE